MLETWNTEVCIFLRTDLPIADGKFSTSSARKGSEKIKPSFNLDYIFAHVFHNLLLITLRFITCILANNLVFKRF